MNNTHVSVHRHSSIAILSSRESVDVLQNTLAAIFRAFSEGSVVIDVLVNGNPALSHRLSEIMPTLTGECPNLTQVRVWIIATADKALAWNLYVHDIWPGSDLCFFVDGYVEVLPDSCRLLEAGLNETPHALAASGVPMVGRSATRLRRATLSHGGIHGNLYAIRGHVLARLRDQGFRLPIGSYRTDPLIAAVLAFNMDPAKHRWDQHRILVHGQASWKTQTLRWWHPNDLLKHGKRMIRQAQGTLETCAIRQHLSIERKPPECLPATAKELVLAWIKERPSEGRKIFLRNPLCAVAARTLSRSATPKTAGVKAVLVAEVSK